jgi:putative tryptophan/tyrosine transport system substrate-binding protein
MDLLPGTLTGANPSDFPVQQLTKFEFVINVKTAKAFEFNIPKG